MLVNWHDPPGVLDRSILVVNAIDKVSPAAFDLVAVVGEDQVAPRFRRFIILGHTTSSDGGGN